MREIWLSLGFWMIFGLPSGETTRRERPAHAAEKPAATQPAQPARQSRTAEPTARGKTPDSVRTADSAAEPAATGASQSDARPDRAAGTAPAAADRGHAEVRYGPSLPLPTQDYQ